jgi:putative hydrolase of the HAD superfamily
MSTLVQPASKVVLILTDADNTLWDTDAVYARAQERLLRSVETQMGITSPSSDRLAFVRDIDQDIAAIHHGRLRYPASLLARALSLRLLGIAARDASRIVCRSHDQREMPQGQAAKLEEQFYADLKTLAPLRIGLRDGLSGLGGLDLRPLIVTEGHKKRCEDLLSVYGLEDFFEGIVEAPKHSSLFSRLLRLHGGYDRGFMVGDQLDRDIAPAKEAGFTTLYFPSGFVPKWTPEIELIQPSYQISSFAEVPKIVRTECAAPLQHG